VTRQTWACAARQKRRGAPRMLIGRTWRRFDAGVGDLVGPRTDALFLRRRFSLRSPS